MRACDLTLGIDMRRRQAQVQPHPLPSRNYRTIFPRSRSALFFNGFGKNGVREVDDLADFSPSVTSEPRHANAMYTRRRVLMCCSPTIVLWRSIIHEEISAFVRGRSAICLRTVRRVSILLRFPCQRERRGSLFPQDSHQYCIGYGRRGQSLLTVLPRFGEAMRGVRTQFVCFSHTLPTHALCCPLYLAIPCLSYSCAIPFPSRQLTCAPLHVQYMQPWQSSTITHLIFEQDVETSNRARPPSLPRLGKPHLISCSA